MKKALINWKGTETVLTWQGIFVIDARDLNGDAVPITMDQQLEAIDQAEQVINKTKPVKGYWYPSGYPSRSKRLNKHRKY